MAGKIHSVDQTQTIAKERIMRDTRTAGEIFGEFLKNPFTILCGLAVGTLLTIAVPAYNEFYPLVGALWLMATAKEGQLVELKLPIQSGKIDPFQTKPGREVKDIAQGIMFLGNCRRTGTELWLTDSDCRQHFLVYGTTGAGKTEFLIGFHANALSWGGGGVYLDGKADNSLFAKLYSLALRFGREDDVLLLNFSTTHRRKVETNGAISSNTFNPFSLASADALTNMLVSIFDSGGGGDNRMWVERAVSLIEVTMRILVYYRDLKDQPFHIQTIRSALKLEYLFAQKELLKREEAVSPEPATVQQLLYDIEAFLSELPGCDPKKPIKDQHPDANKQFAFLSMQLSRALGSLSSTYGHIYMAEKADIDLYDVVTNRRLVVVMIPGLEKSQEELSNVGKIVLSSLKGMLSSLLGSSAGAADNRGTYKAMVEMKPSSSSSPFVITLDELGFYLITGYSITAAQARSLGISHQFSAQSSEMLKLNDEKEAKAIVSNANTKVYMKASDSEAGGYEELKKLGELNIAMSSGYSAKHTMMPGQYRDDLDARFEKTSVIDARDLMNLREGEYILQYEDRAIHARSFHAGPEQYIDFNTTNIKPNQFLAIKAPSATMITELTRLPRIIQLLSNSGHQSIIEESMLNANRPNQAKALTPLDMLVGKYRELAPQERGKQEVFTELCMERARSSIEASNKLDMLSRNDERSSYQEDHTPDQGRYESPDDLKYETNSAPTPLDDIRDTEKSPAANKGEKEAGSVKVDGSTPQISNNIDLFAKSKRLQRAFAAMHISDAINTEEDANQQIEQNIAETYRGGQVISEKTLTEVARPKQVIEKEAVTADDLLAAYGIEAGQETAEDN